MTTAVEARSPSGSPATHAPPRLAHHFTVDVEEYFQVSALARSVPRDAWDGYESRVERSTLEILEMLGRHDARGTFFILGWVAERLPNLVCEIARRGHEVASHGWDHRKVTDQTPAEHRESVRRTKAVLEDLTGTEVLGFRAPSFSIVPGWEWALDVLLEEGYAYDSSLFPIRRPDYGYPAAGRDHFWLDRPAGRLAEFPPATLQLGVRLPAAGGGYLRLLPLGLIRSALRQAERRGQPGTFYIHPWELDPGQPRIPASRLTRMRHYGGLARTAGRIEQLLREFRFQPIASTLATMRGGAARAPADTGRAGG